MSRELSLLERFERLMFFSQHISHTDNEEIIKKDKEQREEDIALIKTALKEHELMKQTKIVVADKKIGDDDLEKLKKQRMFVGSLEQCEIKPLFDEETQKKLKAFEIIKEKGIETEIFSQFDDYEEYEEFCENNETYRNLYGNYTKEEFDLLKEVLL